MRRRWESKGSSRRRRWRCCSSAGISPAAAAASSIAVSVGSPLARQGASASRPACAGSRSNRALLQRAAQRSSSGLSGSAWDALLSGSQVCSTAMRLLVRVPVLSLQITLTEPRVSTAERRRTRAWLRAMRCTFRARARVTVGSRPSGTLATMIPTANTRLSSGPMPTNNRLRPKASSPIVTAIVLIVCTMRATCCSRVLMARRVPVARWATWPNSVSAPVA